MARSNFVLITARFGVMYDKQSRLEKLLMKRYGFVFKETVSGSIGVRVILIHLYGLEVSISPYRVCFYGSDSTAGDASLNSFPAKNNPHCFDIGKTSRIREYLEKTIASRAQSI